ncbi:FHA domain-containing protein [Gloeocapsopsis dulcis]|uniref:Phosphopeptide-binding protein n=1 Tax=Gloeocapsopsis dulcis AAB1 = 1H9 TaxID=1433147 RepID=A0A6N8FS34_9CHRO|nr:FHA domain-containing protein [Gloeocapsopsis dulcis]MUL35940.1 phosphopeptide-binding protein [Gloeocapsopsis dulcis AAB1 = 1H9]WNN88196.1 FHA domain-containing protein [Gloeocapsopsis dulcis]
MIVCPNCNHSNPDGAQTCEACYTPLPATATCPNCGATVQTDASFCGQCGFNLKASRATEEIFAGDISTDVGNDIPALETPEPLVEPQRLVISAHPSAETSSQSYLVESVETPKSQSELTSPASDTTPLPTTPVSSAEQVSTVSGSPTGSSKTQLQQQTIKLLHVQTDTNIELPQNLGVIHIGKPNDRIPPDIDVSGFPNSEIVSRIHADIRVEGDAYFVEDVGSSNGTYVNSRPLQPGDRHRLRAGDRIALGKGDLVTFLFQMS